MGEIERQRFRAVLLDEFQDTSEAQLALLRSLFHHRDVALTAVGDPNQSIYGWRGASATTLLRFPTEFADDRGRAGVLPLSTSWRNDRLILDAANAIAGTARHRPRATAAGPAGCRRRHDRGGPARHGRGRGRPPRGLDRGPLVLAVRPAHPHSAAVLCRRRSSFPLVLEALRRHGLPVEVVGLGGLLVTPEVSDLVAALWVVQDPTRGDQLMRLLTGPVVRLGAADLAGLWSWARELHRRPWRVGAAPTTQTELSFDVPEGGDPAGSALPTAPAPDGDPAVAVAVAADGHGAADDRRGSDLAADSADTATLVDALDDLPRPGWVGRDGARIGDEALRRLHDLADVIRRLRRLTALPLVDLVSEAEVAIGLDIEVLSRPEHTASTARVHLDAFADVAGDWGLCRDDGAESGRG